MTITFRRLTEDDLPLLHRWLNEPGVVRWWEGNDVSWEAVVADYGPDRDDDAEHWVAELDGRPIGWIQCDLVAHWPEESEDWAAAGARPDAMGIDYLVGEPGERGTGLGSRLIDTFVTDVVFGLHPEVVQVGADPFVANEASWRALANAGFRHLADLDEDSAEGPSRLMIRDRPLPAG